MNPYYNHQWRPAPPSVCLVCSQPHFPFCPSVPPFYRPHQPSCSQQKPPQIPDSYHNNGSHAYHYRSHSQLEFVPPSASVSNFYVPDAGRSFKRPRVELTANLDDERRLKLIRDHGAPIAWTEQAAWPPMGQGQQSHGDNLNNGFYRPLHQRDNIPCDRNPAAYGCGWYSMPPLRGSVDRVFPAPPLPPPLQHQPPLPASPPPPPPPAIQSPPNASVSLFPVQESRLLKRQGNQISPDMRTVIDASRLFKQPYRASRSERLVIILRGLPGSGKSYMAKRMRDLELENGGEAPRIHSMDDYFMTEVEKDDDCESSKPSTTSRSKKPTLKKVLEYCYEPEMEEAYRESMLKAFKKTLEDGVFKFVIVDDRNLRVADFAQFWATAKLLGCEVYISEAAYKDPVGCAARNVHGFTLDEIKKMAIEWEETPVFYLQLDVKTLFEGDDLKDNCIQEVDMDSGDDSAEVPCELPGDITENALVTSVPYNLSSDDLVNEDEVATEHNEVRELGKSKWLDNLNEENIENSKIVKSNVSDPSDLIKAYQKRRKSVRWSDEAIYTGFSIGAVLKKSTSLVIGPGPGYNLKSNPLSANETDQTNRRLRNDTFHERMRAERESFKAVFDSKRQRIGGLGLEEN